LILNLKSGGVVWFTVWWKIEPINTAHFQHKSHCWGSALKPMRIRIQHLRSMQIQGFEDQNFLQFSVEIIFITFLSKIVINVSLGIIEGHPS
jgi:hypothetical protein